MKNYELLLMFNIKQDESTLKTVDKYKDVISSKGGAIDRYEDWGTMKLAYNINKINKYIMVNCRMFNVSINCTYCFKIFLKFCFRF